MSSDSSFDEVEGEMCNWRSSLSASEYETTRGRGRVLTDVNYRNKLKLASEVVGIQEKVTPLGYMPTTQEVLNDKDVNEITPLLRQLGISGQGEDLSSRRTRKVAVQQDDIRIEGNVPIILNSELFAMIDDSKKKNGSNDLAGGGDESYDPDLPLHEQFTTIKEFVEPETQIEDVMENSSTCKENVSNPLNSSQTTSEIVSSLSFSDCDDSSSSSNNTQMTTETGSEKSSNDEMFLPLLEKENKFYTPRQLYELRKLHLKQSLLKVRPVLEASHSASLVSPYVREIRPRKITLTREKSNPLNSSQTTSETVSSLSFSDCDDSSSSSNNTQMTTETGSEKSSNDEMFLPLLEKEKKFYTPRQLYEFRKLHLRQSLLKGKI